MWEELCVSNQEVGLHLNVEGRGIGVWNQWHVEGVVHGVNNQDGKMHAEVTVHEMEDGHDKSSHVEEASGLKEAAFVVDESVDPMVAVLLVDLELQVGGESPVEDAQMHVEDNLGDVPIDWVEVRNDREEGVDCYSNDLVEGVVVEIVMNGVGNNLTRIDNGWKVRMIGHAQRIRSKQIT
jgi:hypothetical protein